MQLAIALYNNDVDNEDELEFRRGDILTVLIENPNGFDGWWLCKHKDKYGLCPGNRLKLIQNTNTSSIKLNDYVHSNSRLSTASMYDDLSSNYDNPIVSSSSSSLRNYDNDNPQDSKFISNSSPESSLCSSGIYSTNDLHLSSSSSSDFYTIPITNKPLSLIDLDQLQNSFQKLSVRSSLIDKYCQLILKTNIESIIHSFIDECYLFLHNYGCLLDRYTYRLIKENYLYELEHKKKQIIELSTKIIQLIKSIIDLRLKEKFHPNSLISNHILKKLHLKPITEISNEKINTSLSTIQIYGNFLNNNNHYQTDMKNSKTCFSDFLSLSSYNKTNDYEYMNNICSINPLIKCYYRHINEQINLIIKRFSYLLETDNKISLLITEGKALTVAGHKLIFVLETLHEHVQQIHTSLIHLTTQLYETLKNLIQLLKEFTQTNCTNIQKLIIQFKQNINMIMHIVQRIKQHCSLV
ncbi:unnamed protein product [Rotaria sordida]|uniref:SH3 domain-containing protein n=1 Tax=Rotaria sordida TaxID=392033 RepID=A0A819JN61_9BILA|nr:unnamed protein product [Rotaria sordida]CAF3936583.1 unnamed protein product [Rotaria sordida]